MIIQKQETQIQIKGETKAYKTEIDPKNTDIILSILSSNLYSHPIRSFLRETVSNAWDAHVEAHQDKPIILTLHNDLSSWISIRDFGTGLSPKRVEEVYRYIGSSTKRDSNDYIGAWGLGHLSPLACSDVVYVTSFYKRIKYQYLMMKDGNNIVTNLVNTLPTEEPDGVEIRLENVKVPLFRYIEELEYIKFFPVYVNLEGTIGKVEEVDNFNNTKIKRGTYFSATSTSNGDGNILIGNVLYSIDTNKLYSTQRSFASKLNDRIVINFKIGELDVTPNREALLYNDKTVKALNARYLQAEEELNNLVKAKFKPDYDDILEYYEAIHNHDSYNPVTNELATYGDYKCADIIRQVTYKHISLSSKDYLIFSLLHEYSITQRFALVNGRPHRKKTNWENYLGVGYQHVKLIGKGSTHLISALKDHLMCKYAGETVIFDNGCTYEDFSKYMLQCIYAKSGWSDDSVNQLIVDGIWELYKKNETVLNLDTDQKWQERKKIISTENSLGTNDLIIRQYDVNGYAEKKTFTSYAALYYDIKKCINSDQGLIVLNMKSPAGCESLIRLCGFQVIRVKKALYDTILEHNYTFVHDWDWFCRCKKLRQALTIYKCFEYEISRTPYTLLELFWKTLPKELCEFVKKGREKKRELAFEDIKGLIPEDCLVLDPYIVYLCDKVSIYFSRWLKAQSAVYAHMSSKDADLINAYIMKSKLYRINYDSYKQLKENFILKTLLK